MSDFTFESGKPIDLFEPNDTIRYGVVEKEGKRFYRFVCRGIEDKDRANALMTLAGDYLDACERTKHDLPFRTVKVESMLEDSKFYVGKGRNYRACAFSDFIKCIDRYNRYEYTDSESIDYMIRYCEAYCPYMKGELEKIKLMRQVSKTRPLWRIHTTPKKKDDSWLDWLNPFADF